MKLYPHLAWDSIRKNKKLYLPYWLTCALCVCMFFILHDLSNSPTLKYLRGGSTLGVTMGLGVYVMGLFSAIFLFYTQSFLIRRRKKEFGLYNVLGMNKRAIGRILFWETVITAVFSLSVGLVFGAALSKLSELALARLIRADIEMGFHFGLGSIRITLIVFLAIFVLILLNSIRQVRFSTISELLKSETSGEKPPKANWVLAVLGILLLGAAYYLCIMIKSPISALLIFFIAVLMVIVGTYLVMISGSVTICTALKKNKAFYYQEKHFISIGSLTWRMKRNGAGLASICILATMVLVMISSTSCLFFGAEDSLRTRYPRELSVEVNGAYNLETLKTVEELKRAFHESVEKTGIEIQNPLSCLNASFYGLLNGDTLLLDPGLTDDSNFFIADNLVQVAVISAGDYRFSTGENICLQDGEILIYSTEPKAPKQSITLGDVSYRITGELQNFQLGGSVSVDVIPCIYLVAPDVATVVEPFVGKQLENGYDVISLNWLAGFDTESDSETQKLFLSTVREKYKALQFSEPEAPKRYQFAWSQRAAERNDFYETFGGFFFLGILLGMVFLAAAALIIYYKQICEGYEDQPRFAILMKLGMSRKAIWKSIRSQMLTVFYLPLVLSAIHLSFAFLMIRRLLFLFNVNNLPLLITTAVVSVLAFALFYVIVYRITAKNYYEIVCGEE